MCLMFVNYFFFSSRRRHTRYIGDWSSDVCSSDLFVRFLCVLLRLVEIRLLGKIVSPKPFRDQFADLGQRVVGDMRSEERRVGKECRLRWEPYSSKKK